MYKLGNLTIIFPSYSCDRSCPFCIAKNNRKFNGSKLGDFDELIEQLEQFRKNGISFERIVLSGNGEPSLYSLEELKRCARIIKDNEDLFDVLRVHTSGNIFWEKEKFDLFNELVSDVEFDVLRVAINSEKDMQVLEYNRDYTQAEEFKRAKRIKFDIGLTRELESDTLPEELEKLLQDNPNVGLIRFKNLMSGEHEESIQAKWVKGNRMSKDEFIKFATNLLSYYKCTSIDDLTSKSWKRIIFENSGNYPKDIVYSDGMIRDYTEKPIDISTLKRMALRVDNTKALSYDDIDRGGLYNERE